MVSGKENDVAECGEKGTLIMTTATTNITLNEETVFEASYERVREELEALAPEDLVDINLDIPSAVLLTLGVLPQLAALREAIVVRLANFDIERFDRIEDYAKALSYANAMYATATRSPDGLKELYDEGIKLRTTLHNDILALVGRELIAEAAIKSYTGFAGYKNVATDLQYMAHVLKANFSQIEGKCATTTQEVEHALKVSLHLLRLAGQKEQSPATIAAVVEMRTRAFTVFTRAYDDARRAVIYLRWHEKDADEIAPSLYAGRGGSRKRSVEVEAATEVPARAEPVAPEAAAVGSAAGENGGAGSAGTAAASVNPFLV